MSENLGAFLDNPKYWCRESSQVGESARSESWAPILPQSLTYQLCEFGQVSLKPPCRLYKGRGNTSTHNSTFFIGLF